MSAYRNNILRFLPCTARCSRDVGQKLIDDLVALKSHINKKYTEDKEAGKIKDNWLEKALKSYDPEAKDKALRRNCHPLMNSMTT